MKRFFVPVVLGIFLFLCSSAHAQVSCPSSGYNGKLACMLPNLYGPAGQGEGSLSGTGVFGNPFHVGHFNSTINNLLGPINSDVAQQLSFLPLASPGSGFSLVFDTSLKTFVTSTDTLGPILSERANTVGRHRLALGVAYQFFQFDKIDGVSFSNIPAVYTHNAEPSTQAPAGITCSPSISANPDQNLATFNYNAANNPQQAPAGSQLGDCSFVRDRFETKNNIKLHLHQVTAYATFGVTRNLDVSVVIPFVDVIFGVTSQAHIVTGTYYADHIFRQGNEGTLCQAAPSIMQTTPFSTSQAADCFAHSFPDNNIATNSSPASSSAKGIGDVTVRVKDRIWSGERLGIAAGLDIRFPTGDALNYLGSGAYGIKPFLIASYRARVAPHATIGFEANGTSVTGVGADVATGTKGQLPNQLVYDVGVDAYATTRLTGVFDIIGLRVFNTQSVSINNSAQYLAPCFNLDFTAQPMYYNSASPNPPASCDVFRTPIAGSTPIKYSYFNINNGAYPNPQTTVTSPTLVSNSGVSTSITSASAGLKIALVKRLVLSLNVLVRLDHGGLDSKPAPMAALGYTF